MNAEFWAGKEMSGDKGSTEGPRIVIEASVLVVTLLFIVTQLGTFSDKPPVIGSMAGIGSVFILAAIFATMALGDVTPHAARGFFRMSHILFLLGLVGLWGLLVMLGVGFGLGENFGIVAVALFTVAVIGGLLFSRKSARHKSEKGMS